MRIPSGAASSIYLLLSSALLAIFFGAALGNVVRGVPLAPDRYFFEPLWTDFRVGTDNGILDWYTVLTGVIALVTLTVHGALYIVIKTEGELNQRARQTALGLAPASYPHVRRIHRHDLDPPNGSRQRQTPPHRIS